MSEFFIIHYKKNKINSHLLDDYPGSFFFDLHLFVAVTRVDPTAQSRVKSLILAHSALIIILPLFLFLFFKNGLSFVMRFHELLKLSKTGIGAVSLFKKLQVDMGE